MLITPGNPKKKRGRIILRPLVPPQSIDATMRRLLDTATDQMREEIEEIANRQADIQHKYKDLWQAMNNWEKFFERLGQRQSMDQFKASFDITHQKLVSDLTAKLKVNVSLLWDNEGFRKMMDTATAEASSLIRTIPQQYINDVARAILNHEKALAQPENRTLWQQVRYLGGVSKKRAIFIARDQTAKMSSAISEFQQTEAGIEEYVWSTSRDNRVVGNPSGLYPHGSPKHMNHYKMNGLICRWDDSAVYFDGKKWVKRSADMPKNKPGQDIQCRCVALPYLDRENIFPLSKHS